MSAVGADIPRIAGWAVRSSDLLEQDVPAGREQQQGKSCCWPHALGVRSWVFCVLTWGFVLTFSVFN